MDSWVKCRGWPPSQICDMYDMCYLALLPGEHMLQGECSHTPNAGSVGLA